MALKTQDRVGRGSPYTQGYWDADFLLRLDAGSDYGLSRAMVEALCLTASTRAKKSRDPQQTYLAGARERIREEFDVPPGCEPPSLTRRVVEDGDGAGRTGERRSTIDRRQQALATTIRDAGFSLRVRKACLRAGVQTVGDLVQRTANEIEGTWRNIGITSLYEIRTKLHQMGLQLRNDRWQPEENG